MRSGSEYRGARCCSLYDGPKTMEGAHCVKILLEKAISQAFFHEEK